MKLFSSLNSISTFNLFSKFYFCTNYAFYIIIYSFADLDRRNKLTKEEIEIDELGKPRLGKFKQCQITIKESKEFRVDIFLNINNKFKLNDRNDKI